MMKRFVFLFLLLLLFEPVLSHVSLQYPYPRDTLNDQSYEVWQQNEPVISIHPSTCHGLDEDSKIRNGNSFNALDIIEIDLYGSSIHDGGHCSFWYSTDQTYFTKIIDIADCTLYADSTDNGIQVLLPQTMAQACNESCIFGWSFIPYKSQSCQMYMNCADIRVVNTIGDSNSDDESIIINFDTMISNSDCDFVNDTSHFSTTFGQIKTKYRYNEIGLNGNTSVSLATIISSNLLSDTNSLSITIDETEISNNIENDNSTDSSNILCANPNANNIDGIIDYQGNHLSFCGSLCTSTDSDGNENCRCEDGQCCSKSGICGPILIRYSTSYDTSLSKTVYTPLYRNYTYTTSYDSGSYYITQHDNGYYASETLAFKDYCDDLSSENDDWRLIECSSIDDTSDNDNDNDNNSDLLFDLENINIFTVFILIILVLVGIIIILIIIYYVRQVLCKDKFNKTKDMLNNGNNTNNNIERDDAGTPPSGPIQHANSHNNNRDTLAMDDGSGGSGGRPSPPPINMRGEPIIALPQNMQTNEMYDGKNIELAISNEIDVQKQRENEMQAEQDRLYAHNVLMGELIDAPMSQAPLPPKANNIEKNERALQQVGKQNDKKSQNNKNNKKNRKKSSSIVNTSDKHGFIQSPKKIRKQTGFKQRFMSIFKKEGQDDDDDDIEDLYDPADAAGVDNAVAPPAAPAAPMSQGGSIASVASFDAAAAINAVEAAPSMPAPMVPDNDKQVNDKNKNKEENDFTEFEGRDNDDGNDELALNDDNISNNNASILAFAQYQATNDPNYNSNDENDDNDINSSSYDKARSIASGSTSRDTRGTRGTRGTRSSRTSGVAGAGVVNVPRQPFFDNHKSTDNNVNVMNNIEEQAENMDNENDNALLNDGNAAGGEAEGI